jgi:glycine cleavage system H protein
MSALRFSRSHMWARAESDGTVTVGITEFAQHQLGELQYVGLPRVGSAVARDASLGEVESTKTASELYAPCSGSVVAVNDEIVAEPALVNRDPLGAGWMARISPSDGNDFETLLEREAYEAHVAAEAH